LAALTGDFVLTKSLYTVYRNCVSDKSVRSVKSVKSVRNVKIVRSVGIVKIVKSVRNVEIVRHEKLDVYRLSIEYVAWVYKKVHWVAGIARLSC